MYLRLFVALMEGDLCKVTCEDNPFFGHVVNFRQVDYFFQRPFFLFETSTNERFLLESESQFMALPHKASFDFLIELALQTNDKEWFNELIYRRDYECQT